MLALAILHKRLFAGPESAVVDLHDFVSVMGNEIYWAIEDVPARDHVVLVVDLPHQPIDADVAIPLGLIVAESVINSLRHGYPEGRGGRMAISWSEANGWAQFVFADDGVGLSETGRDTGHGLGGMLIESSAHQLGGSAEIQKARGCRVEIFFPWPRDGPGVA